MADDRGPELLVISWVFTGLALVTVALKVFYRAHVLKLGWDDFFILFSLVSQRCKTSRTLLMLTFFH